MEPSSYQLVSVPNSLHHPMWLEHAEVDLDYHLRRYQVASPGGRRELDDAVSAVTIAPLDLSKPLWELYFVEGLAANRFAVIGKMHHALADGTASANLWERFLDQSALAEPGPHAGTDEQRPTTSRLLREAGRDHIAQLRALPQLVRDTHSGWARLRKRTETPGLARNFHPPATFMNHRLSPVRRFASTNVPLFDIRRASKHFGATINDIVLAMCAGALRQLMLKYDNCAEVPIIAAAPTSLDMSSDRLSGNNLGSLLVSLPVHVDDPAERVRLAKLGSTVAKATNRALGPDLMGRWLNYCPPTLSKAAFARMARGNSPNRLLNLPISNVPGPRQRGTIAGVPLTEIYSIGPLTTGSGMNITVWSYCDQLSISVLTDDKTLADPHEATEALVNAFIEINQAAGLSTEVRSSV